jgi:uncharacterized protein YjbI with pentapeptide repeats
VLAIAAAVVIHVRYVKQDSRERNRDALPAIAALGAAGVTLLTIAVQLSVEPTGELRAVLTAGVVCGGVITAVFAAWLNHRRYRVEEARQQVERDKADLERSRHWLEQDKVELEQGKDRREHAKVADETLMRAVEQLGHASPRVRVGTLHSLAVLAAHRPDRAQEVTDLICMYLRVPPDDGPDRTLAEAQKVLHRVISRANTAPEPVRDLTVDLSRVRLDELGLDQLTVHVLDLSGAHITGVTSLRDLRVDTGNLVLDNAEFGGDVWLHGARLHKLSANGAVFRQSLSLERSTVEFDVGLSDCTVVGDADFSVADLGTLTCKGSKFQGMVGLRRSRLRGGGTFLQARFGRADFEQLSCGQRVVLDEAHFEDALRLGARGPELVSLRRTTLSSRIATSDRFELPPGWHVVGGDREDIRYLVAP